METSQSLSIESFSYSWLVNLKPSSFEGCLEESLRASLDASDEASFIEMDPKLTPSKRFFSRVSQDFNFDLPIAGESTLAVVHADELISNGFLMPLFVKPIKVQAFLDNASSSSSDSIPTATIPISSTKDPRILHSASKLRCSSLRRCRTLSRRIFHKYLNFLRPLYQKIRVRGSRAHESVNGRLNPWVYSPPRASVAYSADNWRRSCDSESSIYEAVLHCKKTIGK